MPEGTTRQVRLDGRYAIKTPRPDELQRAKCLNRWEAEMWTKWRPLFGWPHLCPVVEAAADGNSLVMLRVVQDVPDEEIQAYQDELMAQFNRTPSCEYKPADWGRLDGRLVVVDYGYMCDSEEAIGHERADLQRALDMWGPGKG